MSELRDALKEMKSHWDRWYPADVFDGSSGDEGALEIVRLRGVISEALEAPSEMQQLRTRIEQIRDGCLEETAPPGPLDSWDKGYLSALRSVLDEIAEFLGEER